LNDAAHREGEVRLVIEEASHSSDGTPRRDFADEDDTPASFGARVTSNVEAQIDFVEVPMERDRDAADAGAKEPNATMLT
jgi:hypothetical protein